MQVVDTTDRTGFFGVVAGTARSQAATMVLDPVQSTGGPTNRHPDSDQWHFVQSDEGEAVVEGRERRLRERSCASRRARPTRYGTPVTSRSGP